MGAPLATDDKCALFRTSSGSGAPLVTRPVASPSGWPQSFWPFWPAERWSFSGVERTRGPESPPPPASVQPIPTFRDSSGQPKQSPAQSPSLPNPWLQSRVATTPASSDLTQGRNVLGPVEVQGWRQVPDRRIVEELLCFLVPARSTTTECRSDPTGPLAHRSTAPGPRCHPQDLPYLPLHAQAVHWGRAPTFQTRMQLGWLPHHWGRVLTGPRSKQLADEADRTDGPIPSTCGPRPLTLVRGAPFQGRRRRPLRLGPQRASGIPR